MSAGRGYREVRGLGSAMDDVIAAARRRWTKSRSDVSVPGSKPVDKVQLREAFRVFTDATERLEGTYASLRARAEELSQQLAHANAELTRELHNKQALVERQARCSRRCWPGSWWSIRRVACAKPTRRLRDY